MPLLLFVVFIIVPIAELAVIIQVGQLIGVLPTVLLLLLSAVIGSWLLRREGRRAWRAFRQALNDGRVPTREVADGAMVIMGAALMVTPGFITDALGVLCLLPPTRAALRRTVTTVVARRLLGYRSRARGAGSATRGPYSTTARRGAYRPPKTIDGETEP